MKGRKRWPNQSNRSLIQNRIVPETIEYIDQFAKILSVKIPQNFIDLLLCQFETKLISHMDVGSAEVR